MKESFAHEHIRVFDDVLPKDTFEQLWLFMNLIAYQSTAAGVWAKVWNVGDALHKVAKTVPTAAPRLTIQGFIHRRKD